MGTITWYNIFIYYNEQRSCCHTIFVSPCVLLFYPIWIIPITLGLGLYGGFSQISWYWANWRKELTDPEKGKTDKEAVKGVLTREIYFQDSSVGSVTSSPSLTVPRTKLSSSP